MNRKILSFLASLALVALSACGDDDSGPSGPNWKDRGLISWEKLSDGQGLWAMNAENARAFLASASKDSMGVTQTELDLARYANSNSVTLRFTRLISMSCTRITRCSCCCRLPETRRRMVLILALTSRMLKGLVM